MSNISEQRNSGLMKIIVRTILIMSFDLGWVIAAFWLALMLADQIATRINIGIDRSSSVWNSAPMIFMGLSSFLVISIGGVWTTHRKMHAISDYTELWAAPLIVMTCLLLTVILWWRFHFDLGIWQT